MSGSSKILLGRSEFLSDMSDGPTKFREDCTSHYHFGIPVLPSVLGNVIFFPFFANFCLILVHVLYVFAFFKDGSSRIKVGICLFGDT